MKLLMLAGTGDARAIASGLVGVEGVDLVASFAGVTRQPRDLPCETRVSGFGGKAGFAAYLHEQHFDAVLDATHPFAVRMSQTAARVCAENSLAHTQFLRPEWQPQQGDQWTMLACEEDATKHIQNGATVFLATGRQTLDRFANLAGCHLICRQIDPAERPFPFANGRFLIGRPPFSEVDEIALFRDLQVDWLVVKNSGGAASRTKLDAARALGLSVAMINRPLQPDCHKTQTVKDALAWVRMQKEKL